jgi:hypothetical protein
MHAATAAVALLFEYPKGFSVDAFLFRFSLL